MPSAFSVDSCATRPSAMIARNLGIKASDDERNWRQVLISAGNGLFCGGEASAAVVIPPTRRDHPTPRGGGETPLGEQNPLKGAGKTGAAQTPEEGGPPRIAPLEP